MRATALAMSLAAALVAIIAAAWINAARKKVVEANKTLQTTIGQRDQHLRDLDTQKRIALRGVAVPFDEVGHRNVSEGRSLHALPFLTEAMRIKQELHATGDPVVAWSAHDRTIDQLRVAMITGTSPRLAHLRAFPSNRITANFSVIPGVVAIVQPSGKSYLWTLDGDTISELPIGADARFSAFRGDVPVMPVITKSGTQCELIQLPDGSPVATVAIPKKVGDSDNQVSIDNLHIIGFLRQPPRMIVACSLNDRGAFHVDIESGDVAGPFMRQDVRDSNTQPEGDSDFLSMNEATFSHDGNRFLVAKNSSILELPLPFPRARNGLAIKMDTKLPMIGAVFTEEWRNLPRADSATATRR